MTPMEDLSKLRFSPNVAPEVREAIEPHLVKWAFLIPGWCHELNVAWNDRDTEHGALSISVFYEYRNADLDVHANFLTQPAHREQSVVHELLHLSLAPITQVAETLRDALVAEVSALEPWATEMIRQGEESTTCDLTRLVVGRLA
jgi:hypothetical protein